MSIFNCSQGVLPHHQAAALFLRTKEKFTNKKLNSKSSDGRARRAISIINYQQLSLPAIEKNQQHHKHDFHHEYHHSLLIIIVIILL